jgi:pimeloyl-ACP methyl ester carboxylesterase
VYSAPLPGENPYAYLNGITQPTLVLNGVNDIMIASINSWHLAQNIPNAQLLIYPDAGHGAQFQYPERFLKHAIQFLEEESSSTRRSTRPPQHDTQKMSEEHSYESAH